jgi:hypothetical protein
VVTVAGRLLEGETLAAVEEGGAAVVPGADAETDSETAVDEEGTTGAEVGCSGAPLLLGEAGGAGGADS